MRSSIAFQCYMITFHIIPTLHEIEVLPTRKLATHIYVCSLATLNKKRVGKSTTQFFYWQTHGDACGHLTYVWRKFGCHT